LYIKTQGKTDIHIVSHYVDDLVFIGSNEKMIDGFKKEMMKKYEISDLDLLHYSLCIEIYRKGK
jgi:hypothetical protein